jgi:hypothetical protein
MSVESNYQDPQVPVVQGLPLAMELRQMAFPVLDMSAPQKKNLPVICSEEIGNIHP